MKEPANTGPSKCLSIAALYRNLQIRFNITRSFTLHNHPSGDPEPSDDDLSLTRRLAEAGRLLGIEVLDHIIITNTESFYSFKARGAL
jgi:DNA repair protein RadC